LDPWCHITSWWSMIVQVSVIPRRNVCGDIDWRFVNLSRIHHQRQASWLWWCQCQSMSVLLRSTLRQTIILHRLMVIILKQRWSCVWTNMHWILLYSHFNSNFLQIWIHKNLTYLPGKIVHHLAPDQRSNLQVKI